MRTPYYPGHFNLLRTLSSNAILLQLSVIAVVFRQTNILWIVFVAGTAFIDDFEQRIRSKSNHTSVPNREVF